MSQVPAQPNPPTQPTPEDSAAEPFVVTLPDDSTSSRDWYLWAGVLALLTMVSFWPAIQGGFLWGDDVNVTQNQAIKDSQGLQSIWTPNGGATQYYPLTQTTFWMEYQLWKNWPLGYRVVSLVLHAAGAIVLWRLLRRLSVPGAWVAAAIWAVHPLQAESVSWISERSNILSGLLAFSAVLFYLEFAGLRDPGSQHNVWKLANKGQLYIVALLFFVAALLAKSWVCGLPIAILLILWWKRKLTAATFGGLIPLLAAGVIMAAVTIHIETNPNGPIGASGPTWDLKMPVRAIAAGQSVLFYISKLGWPAQMSFSYDRVVPDATDNANFMTLGAVGVIIFFFLIAIPRIGRGPLVAILCYLIVLAPVLGFVNFYLSLYSFVWDHFAYIASAPLIVLGVAIVARIVSPGSFKPAPAEAPKADAAESGGVSLAVAIPACIAGIALISFATATYVRAGVFSSSPSLWTDTVAKNPHSWLASLKLGEEKMQSASEMIDQGGKFAATDPDSSKQLFDLAVQDLSDGETLILHTINSPGASESAQMQAYCEMGACKNLRAVMPGAGVENLMVEARRYLQQAMTLEASDHEHHPDALPYFTMGISTLNLAQNLERELIPKRLAASTRPHEKIPATTQPATPEEQKVVDKFEESRGYFASAIDVAKAGLLLPATHAESLRVLELAAYNRGDVDFLLAGLILGRGDRALTDKYNADAIADYSLALEANPRKVEAQYRIALCYERFHRWEDAMGHLKLIVYSLDHYNWRAYNEIGNVLLARPNASVADLNLAIQCFGDALKLNPKFSDAQENLDNANIMLNQVHSTTQPATAPATQP